MMKKRYLLWVALIIAVVAVVRPMFWLGMIGFAGLMVVLAVFVGLVFTYLLSLKKGSLYREIGFGVLIIITICSVITLKFSTPELSAGEVTSMFSYPPQMRVAPHMFNRFRPTPTTPRTYWISGQRALAAEYNGGGIWKVKVVHLLHRYGETVEGDVYYFYYNENTKNILNK